MSDDLSIRVLDFIEDLSAVFRVWYRPAEPEVRKILQPNRGMKGDIFGTCIGFLENEFPDELKDYIIEEGPE